MDLSLRSIRKNIAALSVFAIIASMLVVTGVANAAAVDVYQDVNGGEWYEADVNWGLDNGVLDETQAYFRAADNASRAEFFTMVARGAALDITGTACNSSLFPDLDSDHWGCVYLTAMAEAGIISGDGAGSPTPGYVRPNDNILRAEAAKVVVEAYQLTGTRLGSDVFTDVEVGVWYDGYMGIANENCVFRGVNNTSVVEPARQINRAESVTVVNRGANPTTDCAPVVEAGALTVNVDGSTPDAAYIPKNGANIPYTVFNFAASSDEDIEVNQVIVTRQGLGLPGDFENLKLYVDGVQKGSEKTISTTTNTATFNLDSDPIVVPAGSSVLVEVRADMDAAAATENSQNQLCIAMSDDVLGMGADSVGEVTVGGTFAACGELMTTTSASVGTLKYTVTQPSTADINVGETDVAMTKVKLDMFTEDVEVNRITFKQSGSASEEDFANVSLWMSGSLYADAPTWDGDYVTFDLSEDPIEIAKGNSKTVELHVDVVGGLSSTAAFDIYRDWHIEGTGTVYGYGVNVTELGGVTPTARDIIGGNLAFSLSANNPVTGDVKKGANDHEFTKFNISTGGDGVTVRKISVTVNGTDFNDIDDVKIWTQNSADEWYVVAGPNDITAALPLTVSFTDTFDVPAATTQEFMITADIANLATALDVYDIDVTDVTVAGNVELEYLADGNTVAAADITGGLLNGNVMTVNTPTLTVALSATPGDKTYVRNTVDRDLVAFDMSASTADDLRVTGFTLLCSDTPEADNGADDDGDGTIDEGSGAVGDPVAGKCSTAFQNLNLYLKDGATLTKLAGPKSMSDAGANDGTVTFSLNQLVEAGSTARLLVRADLASSANQDGYDFNIDDITSEDSDSSVAFVTPATPLVVVRNVDVAGSGTFTNQNVTASELNARIVAGDSTNEPVLKIRFDASELEAWYIKKLNFVLWAGAANDVSHIYVNYKDQNGASQVAAGTITANATTGWDEVQFSGLNVYVPAGSSQTIDVTLDMGTVATGGAAAGDIVQILFDGSWDDDAVGVVEFQAVGASSATAIDETGGIAANVTSKELRLAKSFPVISRTDLSTALAVGDMEVYEFTVAADETGDVSLKQFQLDMSVAGGATTAAAANVNVYRDGELISGPTGDLAITYAGNTGALVVLWDDGAGVGEDIIAAGTSATYTVTVNVTAAPANSSVSAKLTYDALGAAGILSGLVPGQAFVWSDFSLTPHSSDWTAGTADWLNGYLVQGLSAAGTQILAN